MRYLAASQIVKDGKAIYSALLFDDFDTGVGDWGALVQYTVNRQSIFAQLMNLCDDPESYTRRGRIAYSHYTNRE